MRKVLTSLLLLIIIYSCRKEKHCWDVYDQLGNPIGTICDKTEAEIQDQYGPLYDRAGAPKYCWKLTNTDGSVSYPQTQLSEKMANHWFSNAQSIQKWQCGYCQNWLTREKHVFKPGGNFNYTSMVSRQYCGDTCNTIFAGRIILLRETADSAIYHEFVQKN